MNARRALEQGIQAVQMGDYESAYRLLQYVIDTGSTQQREQAWMWLSTMYTDERDVRQCLQAVLTLNPANEWARQRAVEIGLSLARRAPLNSGQRVGAALLLTGGYRHPREKLAKWITLLLSFITICLVALVRPGYLVIPPAVLIIGWAVATRHQAHLLQLAIPITKLTHAELLQIVDDCIRLVRVPPTRFLILGSNKLNATAVGVQPPYSVLLSSALIEALDAEELRFVVGHELGHIQCGHMRSALVLRNISYGLRAFGLPLRFLTLWWDRYTEFTADRAGLLVCGSLEKAQSALLKICLGVSQVPGDSSGQEEVIQRVLERRREHGELGYLLRQVWHTHPFLPERLLELRAFSPVLFNRSAAEHLLWDAGE